MVETLAFSRWCRGKWIHFTKYTKYNENLYLNFNMICINILLDQWNYRGTLDFLVYRAGNVDTLVTNDISISQLGIEIFRSEK